MPTDPQIPSLPCAPEEVDAFLSRPHPGTVEILQEYPGDILVLGAGGKMGLHLCRMLIEGSRLAGTPRTVYAASRFRTLAGRETYEAVGARTLVGDFRDKAFVDSLPHCPIVFYLVGAKFGTAGNPGLLKEINVRLPGQLAEQFNHSRTVALSTGCVYSYARPDSCGSVESSPLDPVGEYARSCLGREEAFNAVSTRYRTPVVLVRLNYSVEFRYGVPVDIARKVRAGEPVDLTMGYVNIIWQGDALNHIIQSLPLAGSPPVPINITGREILRVRDLANRLGELLGREPVLKGQEAESAWLSNASHAHRMFGAPHVSPEQILQWVAAWQAREEPLFDKPTGFERRDGKF